ncbi:hypothetical protein AB0L71_10775 [Streptomyces sp. NPDC052052]|uniref:hypothetical protein n=1 Tax=Streptomyces sp. NPDC052052 TaxID=3154756 RepID=UPI003438996D
MTLVFTARLWVVKTKFASGEGVGVSLRVLGLGEIPAETARVARVVCPRGAFAMRLREEFAEVFAGEAFADLYPERGRPAVAPGV